MKLILLLTIYGGACVLGLILLARALTAACGKRQGARRYIALTVIILTACCLLPVFGALLPEGGLSFAAQRCGNIFLGYFLYFFGPLIIVSVIAGLCRLPARLRSRKEGSPAGRIPPRAAGALMVSCLVLSVCLNIAGTRTASDVRVTEYSIPKEQLSLTEPLRIVLIADLHIGVNSSPRLYEDMVTRINAQEPDMVLVAGDIVTSSFEAVKDPERYAEILGKIESKHGVYVVYGNHDVNEPLFGGFTFRDPEKALRDPRMEPFLRSCGWTLLTDEAVSFPELGGLTVVGRRDEKRPGDGIARRETLPELLKDTAPDAGLILLEHEPAELEKMQEYGIGLVLCGHTHDGQIFPCNLYQRIAEDQSYGLRGWGDTYAAVTSGVGFFGPPIRVGTISEIVVLDLQ